MTGADLIPRRALAVAQELLSGARGIVVNGPRQSGKSELLRLLAASTGGTYATLDVPTELRAARMDPSGFLSRLGRPFLIDEIQRGGDPLVLAVKRELDNARDRGQCVLAGSTRFLFEPRLSESLAGRVRLLDLWPLSVGEIDRAPEGFIDALFRDQLDAGPLAAVTPEPLRRGDLAELIVRGGFPEAATEPRHRQRDRFFEDYATTVTQRDVRELSAVHHAPALQTVLRLAAARTAQELNIAKFAESSGLGRETTRRYLPLLEIVYLFHLLPAWSANFSARAIRKPKLHLTDTGLAAHLLGIGPSRFGSAEPVLGALFETFVVNELMKQLTWSDTAARPYHWRDRSGSEVDLVLERNDGTVVGVECKLARDVDATDFTGLTTLQRSIGDRFVAGVVVHLGDRIRDFGPNLLAVPVDAIWRTPRRPD